MRSIIVVNHQTKMKYLTRNFQVFFKQFLTARFRLAGHHRLYIVSYVQRARTSVGIVSCRYLVKSRFLFLLINISTFLLYIWNVNILFYLFIIFTFVYNLNCIFSFGLYSDTFFCAYFHNFRCYKSPSTHSTYVAYIE